MSEPNAYLIKKKLGLFETIADFLGSYSKHRDPSYQLFVPERFIFGDFKKREEGLTFEGAIYYQDSVEELKKYMEKLKKGKLLVIKKGYLSEPDLEYITNKTRDDVRVRSDLIKKVNTVIEI